MSALDLQRMEIPDTPGGGGGHEEPVVGGKTARRSLVELGLAVAAIVVLSIVTGQVDLLIVIACLIVMIMIHELGHFLAAKHGKMKVTEYFLGFGPRLWSFRKGETEYGIKAFPLGGYVKIPGMTNLEVVDPADEARARRALLARHPGPTGFQQPAALRSLRGLRPGGLERIDFSPTCLCVAVF